MFWKRISEEKRKALLVVLAVSSLFLLSGFVKDTASIFSGLSLITDTISDINDATVEEELIQKQVTVFNAQQRDLEESLRELDYTESEIREILGADYRSGSSNTLLVLRRAAQNLKRAKELIKRLKVAGQINPEVATAGYTAISAKSLSDIKILLAQVIYNQNRDYQDRLLERAREKNDWDKTRKMLHVESVRVRTGNPNFGDKAVRDQSGPIGVSDRSSLKQADPTSVSERVRNWWSGGRDK